MQLITTTLIRPPTANDTDQLTAEQLVDLIWLHVEPSHGIEHLRVQAGPGRDFRLAAFVGGDDPRGATEIVRHLCRQVITAAPRLNGWQVGAE